MIVATFRIACLGFILSCLSSCASARDETLDSRAAAFFETSTVTFPPANIAVGLAGLQAPRNRDFLDFGRESATTGIAPREENGKELIPLKYDAARMSCWIEDYEPFEKEPVCAPIVEAVQMLRDNETILGRYRYVRALPAGDETATYHSGTLVITLAKISAVSVKIAWREGRSDDAYREWAEQMRFANRLCGQAPNWVGFAICQVVEGLGLGTGEMLFFRMPEVIDRHADEALALLKVDGLRRYDLAGMERRWYRQATRYYETTMPARSILPNYLENRFFQHAQQVLAVSSLPLAQLKDAEPCTCDSARDEASGDAQLAATAKLVDEALGKVYTELLKAAHRKNRQRALLATRIIIGRDHVPSEAIPERLAKVGEEVSDPLSYAPMEWDASRRILRYRGEAAAPYLEARL